MANPNPVNNLPPGPGPGRPKGSENKATVDARAAIAAFVDNNASRLEGWLDQIAEKDPKQAFDCFQSVVEYHIPKLARTEHTGDKKAPVSIEIGWRHDDKG